MWKHIILNTTYRSILYSKSQSHIKYSGGEIAVDIDNMCVEKERTYTVYYIVRERFWGEEIACVRVCRPAISALCQPAAGKRFSGGTSGTPRRSLRSHHGRVIQRRRRPEAHRVARDTPPRVTPLSPSPRQRAQNKMYILYTMLYCIISIHLRSVLCARALYRKFNDPTPPPRTRVFILSPRRRRSWWSLHQNVANIRCADILWQ